MSYFKKFTDFCIGVVIFVSSLYLIRQYMAFKPKTKEQYFIGMGGNAAETGVAPGKLEQFFEKDWRMLVFLVAVLLISLLVSLIFKRFPHACFLVSLFPLMNVTFLLQKDLLYEQELLFVVGTLLHSLGCLTDALLKDRDDGKHRLWLSAKLGGIFALCASLTVLSASFITPRLSSIEAFISKLTRLPLEKVQKLEKFIFTPVQSIFVSGLADGELKLFGILAAIFGVMLIINFIFRRVYFIDLLLSLIPLGFIIYHVLSKTITTAAMPFLFLAILLVFANLLLTVFENNIPAKEQQKIKEAP